MFLGDICRNTRQQAQSKYSRLQIMMYRKESSKNEVAINCI